MRKAVERVFGMLKKRFRILKLPLTGGDIQEIESMLFSCFIMHNMNLKDKARMDLGHMEGDWCDHAPGANRARRALYDIVNGRTLLFNKRAYTHFYHKTPDGGSKKARGSPFKSTVVAIEYEPEGIMYTVRHHTDNVFDTVHISDFVTMGCGCYVRMKKVKLADARAHAQWKLIFG